MAIDPWASYNEGMQGLGRAFSDVADAEIKRQERERLAETRQGLASIMAKQKEMETIKSQVANPEYDRTLRSYETAQMPPEPPRGTPGVPFGGKDAESLWSATPAPAVPPTMPTYEDTLASMTGQTGMAKASALEQMTQPGAPAQYLEGTETRPKYSREDLLQQASDYMTSRGDWAGLKGVEQAIDITSKVGQREQQMLEKLWTSVKTQRDAGVAPEDIKANLKMQIANFNRLSGGKQVLDPASVDKMDFSDRGNHVIIDAGDGNKIFLSRDDKGGMHQTLIPAGTGGKEYAGPMTRRGFGTEKEELYPVFHNQNDLNRWRSETNGDINQAHNYNVKSYKKLNENVPPAQMIMGTTPPARLGVQGVVSDGPYRGQPVYLDARDPNGAPYVMLADPKDPTRTVKVPIPGVQFDTRSQTGAYIGNQQAPLAPPSPAAPPAPAPAPATAAATDDGLTPQQRKANLKKSQDPVSMRVVSRINGVQPVLQRMNDEFAKLPMETNIQPLNKLLRGANVMLGGKKINDYDTFVKEATREVQTALAGASGASKAMVQQQIDVLSASSGKTNAQRAGAIKIIIDILEERKKGELAPVYAPKPTAAAGTGNTRPSITGKNGKKMYLSADGTRWE